MSFVLNWWKKYAYILMLFIMAIGLIYPKVMLVFIICMLGPALTGVFWGRYWCGNICPIGNFFDHITIKISNKKSAPSLFKSIIIRTIFLILMMSMFIFEILLAFHKPRMMGMVFYEMILESIIIGTFLAILYHHRVWCHFCPMGSTGAIVTHYSSQSTGFSVSSKCTSCNKCSENCPMGLHPSDYKGRKLSSCNCIQCGNCVKECLHSRIS